MSPLPRPHLVREMGTKPVVATSPNKARTIAQLSLLAVGAMLLLPQPAYSADAFRALKGSWSGSGSARFTGGQSEKLRCSARYSGSSANLSLNVKCASSSANINLTGSLAASGNKVSGNWAENSFGLSGSANGLATGSSVRLRISGSTSGFLTLSVSGNRHNFSITSQGTSLTGVTVNMGRR